MNQVKIDDEHAEYFIVALVFTVFDVSKKAAVAMKPAMWCLECNFRWKLPDKVYFVDRECFLAFEKAFRERFNLNKSINWEEVARLYMRYCDKYKRRIKSGFVALMCGG